MEHVYYEVVFWAYKKTFCGPRSEDVATRFFNEQTQPCKLIEVKVGPVKTARVVVGKK